jgi:hypothetical protein
MNRADPPPHWHVLSLPKRGHTADEYEDAWAADPARWRFAVADGASESAFAALWARLLTEGFLAAPRPRDLGGWLDEARRRWADEVMKLDLPWYAEMKREQGAFATLVGLDLRPPGDGRPGAWQAVAVGDACLVLVRKRRRLRAFPVRAAADFDNRPVLLGSRGGPAPRPKGCSGSFRPGDRLYLMTDALAEWFLRAHEHGRRPWDAVATLLAAGRPDDAFADLVDGLRERDDLRNDDVTLLAIDPAPPPEE